MGNLKLAVASLKAERKRLVKDLKVVDGFLGKLMGGAKARRVKRPKKAKRGGRKTVEATPAPTKGGSAATEAPRKPQAPPARRTPAPTGRPKTVLSDAEVDRLTGDAEAEA